MSFQPTIILRNNRLEREGEVTEFDTLKVVLRFNGISTWELGGMVLAEPFDKPGITGLILKLDNTTVLSGPIWLYGEGWTPDSDVWDLAGSSDDFWMAARVLLPVITGPPYTAAAYDIANLPCESFMYHYVNRNAGPAAKVERRVFGLTLGTDLARGFNILGGGRFHNLAEVLAAAPKINAAMGGVEYGWRVLQEAAATMKFEVYAPTDRSQTVKFAPDFGNLESFRHEARGPQVNYAIVGGGGEGTARTFVEGGDSASIAQWGRVEQFVDQRQTTDINELNQKRTETLVEGTGSQLLALNPADTQSIEYLTDYFLGDKVTVIVGGVPIVDVIREVELTITGDGNVDVKPKVGTADMRGPVGLFYQMQQMRKRLQNLERR